MCRDPIVDFRINHMNREKSVVAIVKDEDIYSSARRALEAISDDLATRLDAWRRKKGNDVLLKPNLLSTQQNHGCNTSVFICKAIADFMKELGPFKIHVGEGTTYSSDGRASSMKAFDNHGYTDPDFLGEWTLLDLHASDPGRWFEVVNQHESGLVELSLARPVVDMFTVSVAKFKTHDVLGFTLSLKNMMGALNAARVKAGLKLIKKGDVKGFMHGLGEKKPHELTVEENTGPSKVALAANIVRMNRCRAPDLAVIDGSSIMEGMGPRRGTACKDMAGLALASIDPVAADATCAALAGVSLEEVQYVLVAGSRGLGNCHIKRIEHRGLPLDDAAFTMQMHPRFKDASWTAEEKQELADLA